MGTIARMMGTIGCGRLDQRRFAAEQVEKVAARTARGSAFSLQPKRVVASRSAMWRLATTRPHELYRTVLANNLAARLVYIEVQHVVDDLVDGITLVLDGHFDRWGDFSVQCTTELLKTFFISEVLREDLLPAGATQTYSFRRKL